MKKAFILLLISLILLQFSAVASVSAAGDDFMVMGKVTDRNGNPIEGAEVILYSGISVELDRKQTDYNGNFDFPNAICKESTLKVIVIYNSDDGKEYKTPWNQVRWYPKQPIVSIMEEDTRLYDYPPPDYGWLWGTIQTDTTNAMVLDGVVYAINSMTGDKYYTFCNRETGQGKFTMYLPKGTYRVYGQHDENGLIYESKNQMTVTVDGEVDISKVKPIAVLVPLNNPKPNPDPASIPGSFVNKISGTIKTKDGKPYTEATVSLLQKSDDGSRFIKKDQYVTHPDGNGYYEFYGVAVTGDDGKEVATKKDYQILVQYTDTEGNPRELTEVRPVYYPNVIIGLAGMEQAARNLTVDFTLDYSKSGWVNIRSDPTGAKLFVDNKPVLGSDGTQLTTPCTAYMEPGNREIRLSYDGYQDRVTSVNIIENRQAEDIFVALDKSIVPAWVTLLVVIIILLAVVAILIWLLASNRHVFMGPLGGVIAGMKQKAGELQANREVSKAHKAQITEQKRIEQQQKLAEKKEAAAAAALAHQAKKLEDTGVAAKKNVLHDVKSGSITKPVTTRAEPVGPVDEEKPSIVMANDIYRRPEEYTSMERINHAPQQYPRDALVPAPNTPATGDRIKVPRTPQVKEASGAIKDKERVLRYIREHPDGVSFIQMSNDLDIIPNSLTLITKELVINDDIEKIKGLYYYKSHETAPEDAKSSVVVWRLDGDN